MMEKDAEKAELAGALARAFCHEENKYKVVDATLIQTMVKELLPLFSKARSEGYEKGREDTIRDNLLLNEIRNEQFALGKKQGWNEAISEAVKVAKENCLVGEDSYPCDTAEKLSALKKEAR